MGEDTVGKVVGVGEIGCIEGVREKVGCCAYSG